MQYAITLTEDEITEMEESVSSARLRRFLPAAGGDLNYALKLYLWDLRLSQSIYLPLQFAEILVRNSVSMPLLKRFGGNWFENHRFNNILNDEMKLKLEKSVSRQRAKRGDKINSDHVISELSLGFWTNLMTRAMDKQLWATGVKKSFPHAAGDLGRHELYVKIDELRTFRNYVAHHHAIYSKRPDRACKNAMDIISYICPTTYSFVASECTFNVIFDGKPKPKDVLAKT